METRRTFVGRGQAASTAGGAAGHAVSRGRFGGGSSAVAQAFQYKARDAATIAALASRGGDFDKFIIGVKVWKPKDGINTIRILPPTWESDTGHFGLDLSVHFSVGPDQQSYLCLHKMQGTACPVCEERVEAQRTGDETYAKEIDSRKRVLVYMIDRDNESEGIQAYAMPQRLDQDTVKIMVEPRTGRVLSVDDPVNGYDVSFSKSGQGLKTRYDGVQIARDSTPLGNDAALQFAIDHPLPSILQFFSYAHIQAEFMGGSAPATAGASPNAGGSREAPPSQQSELPEITWDYVHALTSQELDALCAEVPELASINPAEAKDDPDLMSWICDTLLLTAPPPAPAASPAVVRRGAPAVPQTAEASPLQRMRILRR